MRTNQKQSFFLQRPERNTATPTGLQKPFLEPIQLDPVFTFALVQILTLYLSSFEQVVPVHYHIQKNKGVWNHILVETQSN